MTPLPPPREPRGADPPGSPAPEPERKPIFQTMAGLPVERVYTPAHLEGWRHDEKLGMPGAFPFTRGVYPTMYRGRLWTMRMFAGFGRPEDTNARFRFLLEQGQTGLSTAFDMPALMGYDADHPRARGEVGREGVSVSTIDDVERLFVGIPLRQVTTSMTINCTASVILAMYLAVAERQGVPWTEVGGTIQNDMLKEFSAQKEWICPPEPAVRIVVDMIEFCLDRVPRFHPVSVSGYHIREAGATAVQELAFTLADGIAYVQACVDRGLDPNRFAQRLSFFFDIHSDFFEEIAKLRAARRMWATIMKERFGVTDPRAMLLRTHSQTAGVSLTAQQPLNNVARTAIQALAAVLGGAQSLHTNSYDETWALPTEEAVTVALRTQQIIAEETGVPNVADPLGGSPYVEWMTDELEREAEAVFARLRDAGNGSMLEGVYAGIEDGWFVGEIADASYRFESAITSGDRKVVGVNTATDGNDGLPNTLTIGPEVEEFQLKRLATVKERRDGDAVDGALARIRREAADSTVNLLPALIDATKVDCTLGEVNHALGDVFGDYREPATA